MSYILDVLEEENINYTTPDKIDCLLLEEYRFDLISVIERYKEYSDMIKDSGYAYVL